ncbi:hypothetical protein FB451DRAFT_646166 [Mycena latifolia]|nr:hypothetical protein FB451DRAFT_646166 [Mycena latifolia]
MSRTPVVTKFKTATCALCRQRKLRCDGETPCGPCSRARTSVVCTYTPKSRGQLRSELPKGAACISCRQRKRRCDGNFPCRTCKESSHPAQCQYRANAPSRKREIPLSCDGASTSSSRSTITPSTCTLYSSPFKSPPDSGDDIDTLLRFLPLPDFDNSATNLGLSVSGGSPAPNPITLPSLPSYIGDPILDYTSTGFPDPAQDGVTDLFGLRDLFLDHSWHYGLNITAEKRDALSRGDTSGLIVAPVLVNVCQLMGCLLATHSLSGTWHYLQGQTDGEIAQTQIILDTLQGGDSVLNPPTAMQVHCLLALYYALKADLTTYDELWDKLGDVVLRNLAMFTLDEMSVQSKPQIDSDACCPRGAMQEALSTFSVIVLLEICRPLVLKLPLSFDPSILANFRQLAATNRMGTELNFLRAKNALFLFDSQQLVAQYGSCEFDDPASSIWFRRYWDLIEDIQAHLTEINTPLLEVSFVYQAEVLTLRICVITALAALLDLHALFAPFQPESRRKHGEAIEQIAAITCLFYDTDFPYLDCTVGVAWATALRSNFADAPAQWDECSRTRAQRVSQSLDIIRDSYRKLGQAVPYVPQL